MKTKYINTEMKRELSRLAGFAKNGLNRLVLPLMKDLDFTFDTEDKDTLLRYLHNPNELKADYIARCKEGQSPILAKALEHGA